MSDFYTEKLKQYADLVVPFTGCPFGEPIDECPFIEFHRIGEESKQIEQVSLHTEKELDILRSYHRDCMKKYFNGEWNQKKKQNEIVINDSRLSRQCANYRFKRDYYMNVDFNSNYNLCLN